ncbi:hypothetical protein BBD42_11510 [Paenibacillus sp. BIHB 4019]|uniref:Uncharacterized protein n=1 Tax=Paenibacillus sp. BIHB 4019 TaxID=1870819 RepID=A0A1B2DH12_9BACL|nr:hypothetical protein BBD42_11510 [Paenibacillus sp. BIHB 4019]
MIDYSIKHEQKPAYPKSASCIGHRLYADTAAAITAETRDMAEDADSEYANVLPIVILTGKSRA